MQHLHIAIQKKGVQNWGKEIDFKIKKKSFGESHSNILNWVWALSPHM